MEDFRARRDLISLLDENKDIDASNTSVGVDASNTSVGVTPSLPLNKFKPKSKNVPDLTTNPKAWSFLHNAVSNIKCLDAIPRESKITQTQRQTILKLLNQPDLVVKAADKGRNVV